MSSNFTFNQMQIDYSFLEDQSNTNKILGTLVSNRHQLVESPLSNHKSTNTRNGIPISSQTQTFEHPAAVSMLQDLEYLDYLDETTLSFMNDVFLTDMDLLNLSLPPQSSQPEHPEYAGSSSSITYSPDPSQSNSTTEEPLRPYVCEHATCKESFRFSRDYWQHKAHAHKDFRFRCELGCGKGFARHDNLVQHHRESKRHHVKEALSPISPQGKRKRTDAESAYHQALEQETAPKQARVERSALSTQLSSPPTSELSQTPASSVEPDVDVKGHPAYRALEEKLKLLEERYSLIRKENLVLREENEEWQAKENIRQKKSLI